MRRFFAFLMALFLLLPCAALADGRVYYEIFPASFYDSDGDGMGDLSGVREKLGYLEALGVTGVWLMPVHPSPSYHKYDVMDYTAIAPEYGTVADFESLADALHEKGMTLLLDLVLNHTSSRHPWFLSAARSLDVPPCGADVCATDPLCREHNPYVGYYHFTRENTPGWHAVPGAPGWLYEGVFVAEMPDLNLDNEALRADILSICAYWLDKGADGFRLDAVLHYYGEDVPRNNAFLSWLMENLRAMNPEVYVVGEAWKDAGTIARYYESGISSLFNFPFSGAQGAIVKALREENGAAFARKVAEWQQAWGRFDGASDAPFLGNHDTARIAGTLTRKPERLKMAASLYLTLPGIPFVYYGEEIGLSGSGRDENKRLPMLWDAENPAGQCLPPADGDQAAKALGSVNGMLADADSLLVHYQRLLALRKAYPALSGGAMTVLDTGVDAVCAYALDEGTQTVYVLHNLGAEAASFAWPETRTPAVCLYTLGGEASQVGGMLTLPPMSTYVAVEDHTAPK